jgi:hypothetical protein
MRLSRALVVPIVAAVMTFGAVHEGVVYGQSPTTVPATLRGVWQIVEQSTTGPTGRTVDRTPVGLGGMIIVTERHWSYITETGDQPRPLLQGGAAAATADGLRAAWGPFDAQGGLVEVVGNELHLRHLVAKNPAPVTQPGALLVVSFKVEGKDTAWITQVRTNAGPFQNPFTLKLKRLE